MQENLILVDVGNTTTKVGFAHGGGRTVYSLGTDPRRTPDSLGLELTSLMAHAGLAPESFSACVACSVVPAMDPLLRAAVARFAGCPVLFVPADVPVPLENRYLRPEQVGSDRLVAAWAARDLHPDVPGLVVVDFGTAVTFDCVQGRAYLGGLIFPGPRTAMDALAGATAKLPDVGLVCDAPEPVPGRDTATSIRHGIIFGFSCLVDGLAAKLAAGLDGPVRVVATGGFAGLLSGVCASLGEVVPDLALRGLERLWRNRGE